MCGCGEDKLWGAGEAVDESRWFTYDVVAEDPATHARAGVFHTPHGDIPTPIFMPVGTKATVKGILPETLERMGTKILLNNLYHLSQRPGADLVERMGGVHRFMRWGGPILTDSGGFQVFSHEQFFKLSDEGVRFRAVDYDGRWQEWTPEQNMRIAQQLGADIVMQLDQCVGYPATRAKVARSVELSSMWADRCFASHTRKDQALFGIVQGGMHLDLRVRSIEHLENAGDFPGYGIGGYSVGEDHETMFESLAPLCAEHMPRNKPRYLMGVGNPTTLVNGVAAGIDMFDCVLPTRTARTGTAFSNEGRINLKNARFRDDERPLDEGCGCPACAGGFSRAYIHHMVRQKEMLGSILISEHNIYYLLDLMRRARESIIAGTYGEFVSGWMASPAANDW
ncbi:MAG: tRNA guanosine(34) transglycosylase Tgt [Atopobiaceae bacterium]|jgi:queuine tRNA-ribosyltransferase|uniref:tRNA guanosine(34) transglycosylase Tgt n=1 Tax=Paratractidigestivibacter sp. TaxID=2847316 RepID=UPI003A934A87|nr:tRNA guanosine(34) transglycosylase Tgt [Atopobiaceae bacterium]